jgi:ElaB/YqjD/DUF883 family membrane-anchored ribosome-binding protein
MEPAMPYARDIMPSTPANSRFWAFVQERPLVAAGLGLAIGAFLATLLPPTQTENQMLGEGSDEVKQRARAAVKEAAEHLKAAANRTADAAREFAARVAADAVAAEEQGYPAGTLRAAHEQPSEGRASAGEMIRAGEATIRR